MTNETCSDNNTIQKIKRAHRKLSINKNNLTIEWNIFKTVILIWPIISLPFILYFGLNGDDPKTAFRKSLIASATIIVAIVAIAFGIRYIFNKLNKSNAD